MDKGNHNKLIASIAKSILSSEGIIRKGRSRTWLDDNLWFTTIIEFQPSNWAKGSYLNIGVNFHWYEKDYFSFDIGGRVNKFSEFNTSDSFEAIISKYCEEALIIVKDFRQNLNNPENSLNFITNQVSKETIWGKYHLAMINGIKGNLVLSKKYFNEILNHENSFEWVIKLKRKVEFNLEALASQDEFIELSKDIILKSRAMKKLPQIEIAEPFRTWV